MNRPYREQLSGLGPPALLRQALPELTGQLGWAAFAPSSLAHVLHGQWLRHANQCGCSHERWRSRSAEPKAVIRLRPRRAGAVGYLADQAAQAAARPVAETLLYAWAIGWVSLSVGDDGRAPP